ncbi:Helix-turn-helix domain protein [Oceanibacterium hippocampi]|uniref:Helix-turn-helix domain protein n=2 Tax=Oceanibacterium hippocampi TaxID=745714 RepID=A0A1Y5U0E3_9PROT|nr:helix-turn-helix transcriptional regulator [Oceanibacterium hippocampi]SLN77849.1 Helix-turn-helix domain protein [Oceanibacterium hippocampi]
MTGPLPSNLRHIASSYGSISEFCRSVNINRQQFNRYLNGRSLPSPRNLRRICEHAGVSESDLFLPVSDFISLHKEAPEPEQASSLFSFIKAAQKASHGVMKDYEGLYFKYYYSLSKPGLVRKSLLAISCSEGKAVTKCIEPAGRELTRSGIAGLCKYSGEAIFLGERLFLIEYEYLSRVEISYSVYFPSYMSRTRILPGLTLGVSAGNRREPAASRIVLVKVDGSTSARSALASCGLLDPDAGSIDEHIKNLINNSDTDAESLFFARTVDSL